MEKICSECGKACGSNARTFGGGFGRFSYQTFCGFCFNKYKNDLEARLMNSFRQGSSIYRLNPANLQPDLRERYGHELKVFGEELRRLQKQYRELTGFDWIMPKL